MNRSSRMTSHERRQPVGLWLLAAGLLCSSARAQSGPGKEAQADTSGTHPTVRPNVIPIDRAIVRFSAPEGAGRERPYFIYERELSFEARLVALADVTFEVKEKEPFRRHHLQTALERRIAETLLAALPIDPPLSDATVSNQIQIAQNMIWDSCGGRTRVSAAATAEGISSLEQRAFFRRRALASLYLHQMVAPMLVPSQLELRRAHQSGQGPLPNQPFEVAEPLLRRWYVERNLRVAVTSYYQNARSRLNISYL